MRSFRYYRIQWALLIPHFLSSSSALGAEIARGSEDAVGDDLDQWLAAAQRFKPEVLRPCPIQCDQTKTTTSSQDWFLFPDTAMLAACNQTMLLSMAVPTLHLGDGKELNTPVRACAANYGSSIQSLHVVDNEKAALCATANHVLEDNYIKIHEGVEEVSGNFTTDHLVSAGRQIIHHLALQTPSCNDHAIEFAYFQSAAIGVFGGVEVHQHGITADVLNTFLQYAEEKYISTTTIVQLCGVDDRGSDYNLGIVATNAENLAYVRASLSAWKRATCVASVTQGEDWTRVTLRVPELRNVSSWNNTNLTTSLQSRTDFSVATEVRSRLEIRADCRTTTVKAGEGCSDLMKRCGIDADTFKKYNGKDVCSTLVQDQEVCCTTGSLPTTLPPGNADGTCKLRTVMLGDDCTTLPAKCGISYKDFLKANNQKNLCSTFVEGQQVCCTSGKRPDLKPKPDADGYCATYRTIKNDGCAKIAITRDLEISDLLEYNKNTWGWNGCDPDKFYPDFLMCVSEGSPPMPAAVSNAVCGPTMPGTVRPPSGTNLSSLNPCPLNVCCNIWGQCGTTDDFCTVKRSETGAPGTSGHRSGCVSNCGREIVKGAAPTRKIKVAYYEAWNIGRKCLNMYVESIPSGYTHIHFAFANITRDFKPVITDESVLEQFEIFKSMKDFKRVISFGGWDFSTLPDTFSILREAAKPENRETFKNNIVSFLNEHDLDGIDLDWEYPGAPDIPDVPSDDPKNGLNYYRLLSSIKSAVGPSKSVSFAAPASFWYLRSYPIKDMAKTLDYIIYMTYDLHGQWDYNNNWTSPGCDNGNCLRSHVNETETKDALSMITKAGAPSNKVVVGVTSYGRSFQMEKPDCFSEDCRFTGTPRISNANKGRCTDTAGYISNAEISEIIKTGNVNYQWETEGSNILVYNETEYVAYMDDDMKKTRSDFYDSYNFAGTTDWAIDLQKWWDGGDEDPEEDNVDPDYWSDCVSSFVSLEQMESDMSWMQPECLEEYMMNAALSEFSEALDKFKELEDNGYDEKFRTYETYVKAQIPSQINNFMASDKVDKYFTCKEYKNWLCCASCKYVCGVPGKDCVQGRDCKSGYDFHDMDACPRYEFKPSYYDVDRVPNTTFTLNDRTGFFKDLSDTWGIDEDWITFGNRLLRATTACMGAGLDVKTCQLRQDDYLRNYPLASDNIRIYNPKDIVGGSYSNASDLYDRMTIMYLTSRYDEQTIMTDLVDASSIPAFSLKEAIENMEKIVEKANEIEKKEREEMILNFITGLLFWIPFVGEEVGAAGMTATRTITRLIGGVGDAAMTIYDVVKNPDNAFMSVFSYLAGAGVGRGGFRNAAKSRRSISDKDKDGLGNVKVKLDKIESLRKLACPA